MEKIRRLVASLGVTALLTSILGFGAIAQAATFSDVPASHFANSFVEQLYEDGVVEGLPNGTYGCDATADRAAFSKMVAMAFGFDPEGAEDAGFSDVPAGAWYEGYVNVLAENGVVGGYTDANGNVTGKFGPGDAVTRSAAAKMLVNAASLDVNTENGPSFPDVAEGAWYYDFVETLYFNSVVDGYSNGKFGPGDNLTRCQLAKMVVGAQNPVEREFADDEETPVDGEETPVDDEETPVVEDSSGSLTVSVGTAVAGTTGLPKGATAVEMLNAKFTASGEAVSLNEVVFHRFGGGASTDFTNVYLYNGANRLTTGRTVSSDSNTVTFSGLNISVPASGSVELTLVVDIASGAGTGNVNGFEVLSADAVSHNGSGGTSGSFPVAGNLFTLGSISAGTLKITTWGSLSNVSVGEQGAEIAKFKLNAASEDIWLQRIALRARGSISSNLLSNFTLWEGGEQIAAVAAVNGQDLMAFELAEPQEIGRGNDRFYTVMADIGTADDDDVLVVDLDEDTDLVGIGEVYGYGAAVDSNDADGYDGNTASAVTTSCTSTVWLDASCVTVDGGQFTIAFNGPTAGNIATNGKDVNFMNFSLTSQVNAEVRKLTFAVSAIAGASGAAASGLWNNTASTPNFTDIKLVDVDSGVNVGSTRDVDSSSSDYTFTTNFTDVFSIAAGETRNLKVTMDVANNSALNADTFKVTLNAVSTSEGIRNTGTGDYLTDIVPSTALAGNTMTVQTPSLTVALGAPVSDETVVKGSQNVQAVYFAFTAGQASDVKVTSVKLTGYVDQNVDGVFAERRELISGSDYVDIHEVTTSLKIYDGDGNQIGTQSKSFGTSDGAVTFGSLNWIVEAGQTEQLVAYVLVDNSTTPQSSNNDAFAINIKANADIVAQDESGNNVGPTGAVLANGTATTPTRVITVKSAGKITVAASLNPVLDDKAVSPNATTNTSVNPLLLGRYRIYATDEAFTVTRMTFRHGNSEGGGITSVILKYPTSLSAPTTLNGSASAPLISDSVTFNSLLVAVPKSQSDEAAINVELYVATAGIGQGASSGDRLDMDFDESETFEAIGVGSNTLITQASDSTLFGTTSDVLGNNIVLYKALPTFTKHTASTVCPSSGLSSSDGAAVYCFSVASTSGGAVDLYKVTFDATPIFLNTGTAAGQLANTSGWKLYKYDASGSVQSTAVGSGTWASASNSVPVMLDVTSSDAIVAAGGTNYYVLKAPILSTATGGAKSSLDVKIQADASFAVLAASSVSGSNVWSDRSATPHSAASLDWTNSYRLETLPSANLYLSQ